MEFVNSKKPVLIVGTDVIDSRWFVSELHSEAEYPKLKNQPQLS